MSNLGHIALLLALCLFSALGFGATIMAVAFLVREELEYAFYSILIIFFSAIGDIFIALISKPLP